MVKKMLKTITDEKNAAKVLWAAALLLAAFKIFLCKYQMMLASPELSPIDDTLMFDLANSIVKGEWLGEYNWLTLGKHSFYALWLAVLHLLGINVLVGGQLLYAAACLVLFAAVKPLFKHGWARLAFYGLILFFPVSWAEYTLRIYRDNIYPSLVLMLFSAVLGAFVRFDEKAGKAVPYLLVAGFSGGAAYLTHEDNILLLPFLLVGAAFYLLFLFRSPEVKQKARKALQLLVPAAICLLCVCLWCGMNLAHYGRFIVSDYTSPEFEAAVGAMARACPEDQERYLMIPRTTRLALYEVSPTLATIEPYMESPDIYGGYGDPSDKEIFSGGFHWAFRRAAQAAGYYETPEKARQFYLAVAAEVNAACDEGLLPAGPRYSGIYAPFRWDYVLPTLQKFGDALRITVLYEQTQPTTVLSIARPDQTEEWEGFLHCQSTISAIAYTELAYYWPNQLRAYLVLNAFTWLHRILIFPMMALAIFWFVRYLRCLAKDRFRGGGAPLLGAILLAGFFLSAILRAAAISYIFAIATPLPVYLMYLGPVGCLFFAFFAYGALKAGEEFLDARRAKKQPAA